MSSQATLDASGMQKKIVSKWKSSIAHLWNIDTSNFNSTLFTSYQ